MAYGYFPVTDDQIRKAYAQPTREKQMEMQWNVHEEMMFFNEGFKEGLFTESDLPRVVFSEEEKQILKIAEEQGITLEHMVAYLSSLKSKEFGRFSYLHLNAKQ